MASEHRAAKAAFQDMADEEVPLAPGTAVSAKTTSGETYPMMRQLGGRAHQLLAATRAADHFIAQESDADRDTGSWLISCAVTLADELADDLDGMARNIRASAADPALSLGFQRLRVRAHQLHAATRAADHFLEQESNLDRSTGSWLIACALGLADKLANELEELANGMRRGAGDVAVPMADRRPGANLHSA
ncbi:MAG: hypothetical protein IAE86_10985 [Burkholderiaceae bacterium]|nr:hypothetical protein [Burkholderiaceae bacterium]